MIEQRRKQASHQETRRSSVGWGCQKIWKEESVSLGRTLSLLGPRARGKLH